MYTSDLKILSKLSLLTKACWGLVEHLFAKSLKWKKILSEVGIVGNKREIQSNTHKSTAIPPPGSPSLVGQGRPSCLSPEKIKKSSFKPLFDVGEAVD